jgi:hypothetical protein
VTASLPAEVQAVFQRFITASYTTIDPAGQPVTWPVTPYYSPGQDCIDVTTGLGYPKKADAARNNPLVSLLFSDPVSSGLDHPPMVLVQGAAQVDDADLAANRERYARESLQKLPRDAAMRPPDPLKRLMGWYYTRIYIHVRPERVYVWPRGDLTAEPTLYDAHMEEVRSGHSEEPERFHAAPAGGAPASDQRILELTGRHRSAVLSIAAPDGFPFSIRVPIASDGSGRRIRIGSLPVGVPIQPGLASLTVNEASERLTRQRNLEVRGDLVVADGEWTLVPHALGGGFGLPSSPLQTLRVNAGRVMRLRRAAKRELARRT